ncbi:Maf family protein [Brevibacillus migulae]|uniref:Maf family protein n=1 Tax=Brevibacillus migulae TaxID=1644114 RepID=UPI00106EAD51|nr:Maf family protein [Brevibacillus migulae]
MIQTTIPVILASSSPRRRELLQGLGIPFTVQSSDVDESTSPDLSPQQIVESLAQRKAREVAKDVNDGLVIGADTIVVLDGKVLGKPRDEADAFQMLQSLQGREHTVYSGVTIVDVKTGREEVSHRSTKVRIRSLTEQEINAYIATKEPMDKAGSYAIQGIGATIVDSIDGDYFTVVGLPLNLLAGMLSRFGVQIL